MELAPIVDTMHSLDDLTVGMCHVPIRTFPLNRIMTNSRQGASPHSDTYASRPTHGCLVRVSLRQGKPALFVIYYIVRLHNVEYLHSQQPLQDRNQTSRRDTAMENCSSA